LITMYANPLHTAFLIVQMLQSHNLGIEFAQKERERFTRMTEDKEKNLAALVLLQSWCSNVSLGSKTL